MAKCRELKARQTAFVEHYLTGRDGVRGNATAAYVAAGYSPRGADRGAERLLRNVEICKAVKAARRTARERTVRKLVKWREEAPEAQETLLRIMRGEVAPQYPGQTRDMIETAKHLLDRAYGTVRHVQEHTGKGGDPLIDLDALQRVIADAGG